MWMVVNGPMAIRDLWARETFKFILERGDVNLQAKIVPE